MPTLAQVCCEDRAAAYTRAAPLNRLTTRYFARYCSALLYSGDWLRGKKQRVNIGGTVIVTSTGCEELNYIPTSVTHKQ